MIELQDNKQMQGAIERARQAKLKVAATTIYRLYRVLNLDKSKSYDVNFFTGANGQRMAHCTCKAGEANVVCKHIAAAVALHLQVAREVAAKGKTMIAPSVRVTPAQVKNTIGFAIATRKERDMRICPPQPTDGGERINGIQL